VITTSNFAKSAKHPQALAISQGVPRFYRGKRYMPLAPPRWLLKARDPELFDREYRKQLESLDAKQVAEELGPDAILLCWESFNVRCHRRLVAEWLEEKLGSCRAGTGPRTCRVDSLQTNSRRSGTPSPLRRNCR